MELTYYLPPSLTLSWCVLTSLPVTGITALPVPVPVQPQHTLLSLHGKDSVLATALGSDFKGKISIVIYLVAIPLALVKWWLACALYVLVAIATNVRLPQTSGASWTLN